MAARSCVSLLNIIRHHVNILRLPPIECISHGFRVRFSSPPVRQSHLRKYASASAQTNPSFCWKCDKQNEGIEFVCRHCGVIQEINNEINHFRLFGLDSNYELDSSQLTSRFRRLQSLVHPDKYADKTQRERDYSLSSSSLLNTAYRTLLDPVDRGFYLLSLTQRGVEEGELTMDGEFLAKIMEQNERLNDNESLSAKALEEIRTEIQNTIDELLTVLASTFREGNLEASKTTLAKLKYYTNIISKIKSVEMELGITH